MTDTLKSLTTLSNSTMSLLCNHASRPAMSPVELAPLTQVLQHSFFLDTPVRPFKAGAALASQIVTANSGRFPYSGPPSQRVHMVSLFCADA
jgi:hypothetical protein